MSDISNRSPHPLTRSKEPIALSCFNRKGGTGKTTLTLSLAYSFAKECRVLVIDADPQQSATNLLGYNRQLSNVPEITLRNMGALSKQYRESEDTPYLIDDLFGEPTPLELITSDNAGLHVLIDNVVNGRPITKADFAKEIVTPTFSSDKIKGKSKSDTLDLTTLATSPLTQTPFGFDLLPSSEELTDDELYLVSETRSSQTKSTILKQIINAIKKLNLYDVIIVDCPPSLDLMAINALTGCDASIVVCVPDQQSIFSLSKTKKNFRDIKMLDESQRGILGVVMNSVNKRNVLKDIIASKITDNLGLYLFKNMIPHSVNAPKANTVGLLYPQVDKNADAIFDQLRDEIIERYEILKAWEEYRKTKCSDEVARIKATPATLSSLHLTAESELKAALAETGRDLSSISVEKYNILLERFLDRAIMDHIRHEFTQGNLWDPLSSGDDCETIANRNKTSEG